MKYSRIKKSIKTDPRSVIYPTNLQLYTKNEKYVQNPIIQLISNFFQYCIVLPVVMVAIRS